MTKAEQYTLTAEALRDFNTYQELNQLYINMMWDAQEFHRPSRPVLSHSVYDKGIKIPANLHYSISYALLMASTKGKLSINGAESVRLGFKYTHTLAR